MWGRMANRGLSPKCVQPALRRIVPVVRGSDLGSQGHDAAAVRFHVLRFCEHRILLPPVEFDPEIWRRGRPSQGSTDLLDPRNGW